MKIVSITTEEFRWPRRMPIRNGKHTYTHSGLGVVKIETDENITEPFMLKTATQLVRNRILEIR